MNDKEFLAERFEADRSHLRSVAYRMLGSAAEADDAVQEAWFRMNRSDTSDVQNLTGWLTTVTARVCLDMLRSRASRREDPLDDVTGGGPSEARVTDPEEEALLADSVGLALLVVLETLPPAERLAFVLHDMFAVPFDEIAPIVGRSPEASRQLASRARRRVQGTTTVPDADRNRQREIVRAFHAAACEGDFDGLLALLDPDVVLHVDGFAGAADGIAKEIVGAATVAGQARQYARRARFAAPALIDGRAGLVVAPSGHLRLVQLFTVANGRIVELEIIGDPERLARLEVAVLEP